ncbi:MAG: ferrous iron transporter B [Tissierellia bacterium]|nr:ferrous iron transporter B [Tissierellia bacterium]
MSKSSTDIETATASKRILLMGNPNVGKSVLFFKMTGVQVEISNYTGTTVGFTKSRIQLGDEEVDFIDVPGTYSLESTSEAEDVAVKFLESKPTAVVCVLDSTNLERNLRLALQIKEYNIPMLFVLNLMDVSKRQGINIDVKQLERELGARVIPAVAVKDQGVDDIRKELTKLIKDIGDEDNRIRPKGESLSNEELWNRAAEIAGRVQSFTRVEKNILERLGELTIQPWPGIPIAILVMVLSLALVVGIGKGIRALILLPFVNDVYAPLVTKLISTFIGPGILRNILVGEYGILIKMVEWPLALILPYVFLFYVVISFLEDSGYLPRIGVLMDAILSKLGVQGGSMIPILLGYGCAVPAVIGTRAATTLKERLLVTLMVCFAVPCVSQTGAFISLLGDYSVFMLVTIYLISLLTMVVVAKIADRVIKGQAEPMIIEIPNLLLPDRKAYFRKLKMRMQHFFVDAELPMLIGVLIAALVIETGILNQVSQWIEPLVVNWLGLPKEASLSLLLGIIRRELAVLPLLDMNLNGLQMFVGSIVALYYLPCLSVFAVLIEEFNLKTAISISIATIVSAFLVGGIVNQIGLLFI